MGTLKIANWDRWQTYRKDRGLPPWIKVHRQILRNPDWVSMTDAQKGQLVSIWVLAADHGGFIPDDARMVKRLCALHQKTTLDLDIFIKHGFIEPRDANVTPRRRQRDAPEADTDTKADAEKNALTRVGYASIENLDQDAWATWMAHRRAERLKPYKTTRVAEALAKHPKDVQRAAITVSMDKGWQGLFPEKINGTHQQGTDRISRFDKHSERLREWLAENGAG